MQRIHEPKIPSDPHRSLVRAVQPERQELGELLLADRARQVPLPSVSELTAALTALARGLRPKVLLPLPTDPIEFALVRRDGRVLVSVYETGSAPEVYQLDRPVDLATALDACARRALERAQLDTDPVARQIAVRTAERAQRATLSPDPARSTRAEKHQFQGQLEAPLAFAFDAAIHPNDAVGASSSTSSADIHAMLFEGSLYAFVRGRRLLLSRGPIFLAAQRMVVAVRALVDAWTEGRPMNVRLRTGAFGVGIRLAGGERVELMLQAEGETVRAAELTPEEVTLPILRLASELLRALLRADRTQNRNLRVASLRDELRALRRLVRDQRRTGFVSQDPERLTLAAAESARKTTPGCLALDDPRPSGVRYDERWRVDIGGLDAAATYFCGDRLVLATPEHTLAVDRDSGDVIWAREGTGRLLMAGRTLLRVAGDGDVELCDVADGEPYAIARMLPRVGGPDVALAVGGGDVPPMAVLAEGMSRLVALDVRTGEPRWRFVASGHRMETRRLGRLLLVATETSVHALDVASGEELSRHVARVRLSGRPHVVDDTVVLTSGGRSSSLLGVALATGEARYQVTLGGSLRAAPSPAAGVLLVSTAGELQGRDARTGELLWRGDDPGLGDGAATLEVDGRLIINAPGGRLSAVEPDTGSLCWQHRFGDPLADEVPRQLEPVLRGAALFAPAAGVQIVRPTDGAVLGAIDPDLVADRIRVDERGWVYVAEESGHLAAFAPAPQLRLVRGGRD